MPSGRCKGSRTRLRAWLLWSTLGRGRQGTFWRGRQAVRAQPGGLGSWHPVGDMPGTRALVCWSRETRFVLRCVCVRGQTADSELGDNLHYSQFSHFSFAPHRRRRVHPACEDTAHPPHTITTQHDTCHILTPISRATRPLARRLPSPHPSTCRPHATACVQPVPSASALALGPLPPSRGRGRDTRAARRGPGLHSLFTMYAPLWRLCRPLTKQMGL